MLKVFLCVQEALHNDPVGVCLVSKEQLRSRLKNLLKILKLQ